MTTPTGVRRGEPSDPSGVRSIAARNTAWNYVGFATNLATNLLMFPFVVARLGDAATGVWLLLSALTGYMGVLELGIVPSLTQTVASALARGERASVTRAASTAQVVLAGVASLALAGLIPLTGPVTHALTVPASLEHEAHTALLIALVGFALRMPLATFQGILLGCQRQDRCNQLWVALGFAKFFGAALVLGLGYGLVALVTMEMVVHLLAGVLQVRWVRGVLPELRLSWRLANGDDARRLLSFGGAVLMVSLCSLLIEQTDRVVVAAFLPVAEVTHYAAAWKLYMLAFALTTTVVQAIAPIAAQFHGRRDVEGLRVLCLRWTKYALIVAWPLVASIGLAGGVLLRLWMGERFAGVLPVVQVLLLGFVVTAHNHAGYSALLGMRRIGALVPWYFVPQALLNLALTILLIPRFGIVGVALGTAIPAVALEPLFLRFLFNALDIDWRAFVRVAVISTAIPAAAAFAPVIFLYLWLGPHSLSLLFATVLATCVYGVLVWNGLDPEERDDLRAYLPRRARAAAGEPRLAALAARTSAVVLNRPGEAP
jgi:O-antigen/teichoic acid export membrane protein